MKKLITVLSTVSLVGSASLGVVSCGGGSKELDTSLNSQANIDGAFKYKAGNLIGNDQYSLSSSTLDKKVLEWNQNAEDKISNFDADDEGLTSSSLSDVISDYFGQSTTVNYASGVNLDGKYGDGDSNFVNKNILNTIVKILKVIVNKKLGTGDQTVLDMILPINQLTSSEVVFPEITKIVKEQVSNTINNALDEFSQIDFTDFLESFGKVAIALNSQSTGISNNTSLQVVTDSTDWPPSEESGNLWSMISAAGTLLTIGDLSDMFCSTFSDLNTYSIGSLINSLNSEIGQKYTETSFRENYYEKLFSKQKNTIETVKGSLPNAGRLLVLNALNQANYLSDDDEDAMVKKLVPSDTDKKIQFEKGFNLSILTTVASLVPSIKPYTEQIKQFFPIVKIVFNLLNLIDSIGNFSDLMNTTDSTIWTADQIKTKNSEITMTESKDWYWSLEGMLKVITMSDIMGNQNTSENNLKVDINPDYKSIISKIAPRLLKTLKSVASTANYLLLPNNKEDVSKRLQNILSVFMLNDFEASTDYKWNKLGIYDSEIYDKFEIINPALVDILSGAIEEFFTLIDENNDGNITLNIPDNVNQIIQTIWLLLPGLGLDDVDVLTPTLKSLISNIFYCVTTNQSLLLVKGQKYTNENNETVINEAEILVQFKSESKSSQDTLSKLLNGDLVTKTLLKEVNDEKINSILDRPLTYIAETLIEVENKYIPFIRNIYDAIFNKTIEEIFSKKNDPFFDGIGSKYLNDSSLEKYKNETLYEYLITNDYDNADLSTTALTIDKILDLISNLNERKSALNINEGYDKISQSLQISDETISYFKNSEVIQQITYQIHFEFDDATFYSSDSSDIAQVTYKRSADYKFVIKRDFAAESFEIDSMEKL